MPCCSDNVSPFGDEASNDNGTEAVEKDPLLQGHDTTYATDQDQQCGYSSPRGVCLLIAKAPFKFCTVHLCPVPGCGKKKGSRDKDCGGPCGAPTTPGNGNGTPNPFLTNKENDNPVTSPPPPGKPMTLVQQATVLKKELGIDMAFNIADTIAQAATLLGFDTAGTPGMPNQIAAMLAMVAPQEETTNPFMAANVGG